MSQFHYKAKTTIADIEAIPFRDVHLDSEETIAMPQWFLHAVADGTLVDTGDGRTLLSIIGERPAVIIDDSMWIIKLNDGELTAMPNHLFEALFAKSV